MINLLLGAPGGGKSYEAVAFHVLVALNTGRKVITNLPLVLDEFPPEQRALLDIRTEARGKAPRRSGAGIDDVELAGYPGLLKGVEDEDDEVLRRPFSTPECYGDPWRHPDNGAGPLYVIDECHMCLPREKTLRKVREWYSLHRHELADVLLITQSYGKVHRDVIELVQVCYRVRKATAFGSNNGYIRKVFDGVKGDCVNTSVRKYDKRYFKFYKSHTKTSQAGAELAANDIVPLWKRWPFIGLALCVLLFLGILASGKDLNPMKAPVPKHVVTKAKPAPVAASAVVPAAPSSAVRKDEHGEGAGAAGGVPGRHAESKGHPFAGLGIHVTGYGAIGGRRFYAVVMSQNGQRIFSTTSVELVEAGYRVKRISDCAMGLTYGEVEIVAVCDAPQIGVTPGDGTLTQRPKPSEAGVGA